MALFLILIVYRWSLNYLTHYYTYFCNSPLLSNVVLNEFDWWLSNQWETFQTQKDYTRDRIIGGKMRKGQSMKYRELKTLVIDNDKSVTNGHGLEIIMGLKKSPDLI